MGQEVGGWRILCEGFPFQKGGRVLRVEAVRARVMLSANLLPPSSALVGVAA